MNDQATEKPKRKIQKSPINFITLKVSHDPAMIYSEFYHKENPKKILGTVLTEDNLVWQCKELPEIKSHSFNGIKQRVRYHYKQEGIL